MPSCYYYDEQRNRCNCYINENLNELLAENAKLREVMEDLEECDQIHRTMLRQVTELKAKAKAENAKLRDLATGLYRCWLGEGCDGCPMQDNDGWCIRDLQLRELRIEVDG